MKTEPKISVIIPVYKVEPYIRQCLNSVVNQTYTNLEIIIIDDGSPDNCGEICDEYERKDNRIQVIHKENGGLSAARNDGLRHATGEWISFVDSDDWCELDMYEKAIVKGEESNADIVIFSLYHETMKGQRRVHSFSSDFITSDKKIISQMQLSALDSKYAPLSTSKEWGQGLPWDKLFKRALIVDNHLFFAENVKANEDVIFNIHAFQYAEKIAFIDLPLYHWRMNPTSIGHKYTPDRVEIDREIYKELNAIGRKYNLSEEYYQAVNIKMVHNTIYLGARCFFNKNNKKKLIQKIKSMNTILHEEPIFTVFEKVDRKKLGKLGKFVTISRHHNIILIYLANKALKFFGKI